MAFPTVDDLLERLRCPACGARIAREASGFRCAAPLCGPHEPRRFPVVGDCPALVDFEDSILDPDSLVAAQGASLVDRFERRGLKQRVRELYLMSHGPELGFAEQVLERLHALPRRPTVLVVGGGTAGGGVERYATDPALDLIAFDIYASPHVQFIADAHRIPLADGSVDAVWIQAVLEHVVDPWRVVAEIERVLGPEGLVYAETPFMQQVHEGPYDFTRFTESGHRWLFRGFECLASGLVAGPGTQLAWTIEHVVRAATRSRAVGRAARLACFWVQYLDRLVPERWALDDACCVYFFGRRWDRRLSPREIVAHYKGPRARV